MFLQIYCMNFIQIKINSIILKYIKIKYKMIKSFMTLKVFKTMWGVTEFTLPPNIKIWRSIL